MIGVNVPIPVPAGYLSFGGAKESAIGDLAMRGEDGIRFFTQQKMVTERWPEPGRRGALSLVFPGNSWAAASPGPQAPGRPEAGRHATRIHRQPRQGRAAPAGVRRGAPLRDVSCGLAGHRSLRARRVPTIAPPTGRSRRGSLLSDAGETRGSAGTTIDNRLFCRRASARRAQRP